MCKRLKIANRCVNRGAKMKNELKILAKMRILFVINDRYGHGGHIKSFVSQFLALRNKINSFHIICAENGYLSLNRENLNLINSDLTCVDMSNLRLFHLSYRLFKAIKSNLCKYNYLHVYYGDCYFSCLLAKTYFKNISLLCSIMGGPNPFPRLNSASIYIAVSKEQLSQVGAYDKALNVKKGVAVVKNRLLINHAYINLMQKTKTNRGILIVTRFDSDKINSLELLLKVANLLPSDIEIKIAGTGKLFEKYKNKFSDKKNIEFLGYCHDFSYYYENTAVVLGMGRSILEFMINGMPGILVGFSGIQILDTIESVKFASDRNFAGRELYSHLSFVDSLKYIVKCVENFTPLNSEIVEYLRNEYDISVFPYRYADIVKKSYPKKITLFDFTYEYIYVLLRRIDFYLKSKRANLMKKIT